MMPQPTGKIILCVIISILLIGQIWLLQVLINIISYQSKNNTCYINSNDHKYNIFFAETNSKREYFSPRQICAIESAALNNPLAIINVYSINAKLNKKWLEKYSNIKIIKLDYDDLFKETYFENWFKANKQIIYNSQFTYVQLSDMVRLVVLLKYGGYYSDLDTITIKSIEPLLKYNGAGLQADNPIDINNANLIFYKNHSFLTKWIPLSVESFNPNAWGSNGQQYQYQ